MSRILYFDDVHIMLLSYKCDTILTKMGQDGVAVLPHFLFDETQRFICCADRQNAEMAFEDT